MTKPATQELTIKVDASEAEAAIKAVSDHINRVFRDGADALRAIAGRASAEMIQGEALAIEPDLRLDEIMTLLKRIDTHLSAPIHTVASTPGR